MKFLVIFALLLAASPAFSRNWQDGPFGEKWDYGCNFHGHDMKSVEEHDKTNCGRHCYNDPQCTHFFHGFDVACNLKRSTDQLPNNLCLGLGRCFNSPSVALFQVGVASLYKKK